MKTDTRLGTFEEVLAEASDEIRPIAVRLREIIEEMHPDTIEVPRPRERAASYGVGPKKMSEAYTYIMPQKNYVNLGFYHGVALSDPANLLEGGGKRLRHVKIYSLEQAESAEIKALIAESIREWRETLN